MSTRDDVSAGHRYNTLSTDSIPGYELIKEVHRGGQGVVYQAIQKATRRRVAIKVMREGPFVGPHERSRFEREVQILAALQHPHIVSIHDSGVAAGNFYFTMDYISGSALDRHIEQHQLSVDDTLRLFAKVCEAVSAAHLRGIIHRDLKPANIRVDAEGEPHILDFGLARVAVGALTDDPPPQAMTITGEFIGSPPWSAPEQAEGSPHLIDIRTDVYALGVILYQVLTGRFPYDVTGNLMDVLQRVRHADPVRPSTIRPDINDEVETILLKCLSKERERRYQSAGELARDINHYLAGEPIEAKRDSTIYLLKKALLRYRIPVAVASGFLLLIVVSLIASLALWRQAETALEVARVARDGEASARVEAEAAKKKAEERADAAMRKLYGQQAGVAARALNTDAGQLNALLAQCPPENRGWEWYRLKWLSDRSRLAIPTTSRMFAVAFSPDGAHVASGNWDGSIHIIEVATGKEVMSMRLDPSGVIYSIEYSPDGLHIVSADKLGNLNIWNSTDGRLVLKISAEGKHDANCTYSPDGKSLIASYGNSTTIIWNATTGERIREWSTHEVTAQRMSPSGDRLATGGNDGHIFVWDTLTRQKLLDFARHETPISGIVFSSDGQRIISSDTGGMIHVWFAASGEEQMAFRAHAESVSGLAGTIDGAKVISASRDGTLKIWDAASDSLLHTLRGHAGRIHCVAVSPNGKIAASGGQDATVRLWDMSPENEVTELSRQTTAIKFAYFQAQGKCLVTKSQGQVYRLYNPQTGQEIATYGGDDITWTHFSPRGDMFAVWGGGQIQLRDTATGNVRATLSAKGKPVFSNDGSKLYVKGSDENLHAYDTNAGASVSVSGNQSIADFADQRVSPDGRFLIGVGADRTRVWKVDNQKMTLEVHHANLLSARLRRNSALVAHPRLALAAGSQGEALTHIWDMETGEEIATLRGHTGKIEWIRWSDNGEQLLTGGQDGHLKVWDAHTWVENRSFGRAGVPIMCADFAPDGTRVYGATRDGTIRFWEIESGRESLVLKGNTIGDCFIWIRNDSELIMSYTKELEGSLAGVTFWNTTAQDPVLTLGAPCALNNNTTRVISAEGNVVKIWDPLSGDVLMTLEGPKNVDFKALDFSPDGCRIVAGGEDKETHEGVTFMWYAPVPTTTEAADT